MPYSTLPKVNSTAKWGEISGDISKQKDLMSNYIIQSYTWTVNGEVLIADSDTNYICPIFALAPEGKNIIIISAKYRLNSGGTANVSLKCNENPILNYSNIPVDDSVGATTADSDEIKSGDMIALVVNNVNAEPKNLSFTIFYVYE